MQVYQPISPKDTFRRWSICNQAVFVIALNLRCQRSWLLTHCGIIDQGHTILVQWACSMIGALLDGVDSDGAILVTVLAYYAIQHHMLEPRDLGCISRIEEIWLTLQLHVWSDACSHIFRLPVLDDWFYGIVSLYNLQANHKSSWSPCSWSVHWNKKLQGGLWVRDRVECNFVATVH